MNAKTLVRCGGLGLALAATASTAQSPIREPAARLVRAVPVLEPSAAIVVRGLAPTPEAVVPKPGSWINGPVPTTVKPLAQPSLAPASRPPVASDSSWQSLRNFLVGPPKPDAPAPPQPSRAEMPRGMPVTTRPSPMMMSAPVVPTMHPGVYAGPPAYRWYGWGTTTPGRNPLAPTGKSPYGSAGWYAQTGATPGAFPITAPATLPSYASADAPQYRPAGMMQPLVVDSMSYGFPIGSYPTSMPPLPSPLPPPLPPGAVVIADGIPMPQSVPYAAPMLMQEAMPVVLGTSEYPVPTLPVSPTYVGVPMPLPAESPFTVPMLPIPVPPPAPPSVNWSSAAGTAIPFGVPSQALAGPQWGTPPTVARPQAPTTTTAPSFETQIRNAAYGLATVTEVRHVGLSKLLVRLQVKTVAEARGAAEAIAKVPALKPYAVDFEVVAPSTAK